GGHSERVRQLLLDRPSQRRAKVVDLSCHPIEPHALVWTDQRRERLLGKRQDPREMTMSPLRFFAGFAQAIERVLAYRLQHPIASRSLVLLGEDEVLVRQGCEQADRVRLLDCISRASVLRRRRRPPPAKTDTRCNIVRSASVSSA